MDTGWRLLGMPVVLQEMETVTAPNFGDLGDTWLETLHGHRQYLHPGDEISFGCDLMEGMKVGSEMRWSEPQFKKPADLIIVFIEPLEGQACRVTARVK